MTKVLLFLIKLVQGLMLLSAMAAFGYGALHLSQATWWKFAGETVQGQVVEEGMGTERRSNPQASSGRTITQYETVLVYRPVVQYVAPRDRSRAHRVAATLTLEGREAEAYLKGSTVDVRFDASDPARAYLPLPAGAYFWPAVGFFAGGAALLVLIAFFYLHEAAFGRDLSAGVSLFRRLRMGPAVGFALLAAALLGGIQYFAAGLVAPPPPGAKLNSSEALLVGLPFVGPRIAGGMLETAIGSGNRAAIDRYLDAHAESPGRFPIVDEPPRLLQAAVLQRDLKTLKRLLALGLRPSDDPLFDARLTAEQMKLPEFVVALREAEKNEKRK